MDIPHGQAPVYVHDIIHKVHTASGTRPRPTGEKSETATGIPVVVQVLSGEQIVTVAASEWALFPHQAGKRDEESGAVIALTRPARFVMCCVLPAGWKLVREGQPVAAPGVVVEEDHTAPVVDGVQTVEVTTYGPAEMQAIEATRRANDLPEQTAPEVLGTNTDKPAGHYDKSSKMGADLDGKKEG